LESSVTGDQRQAQVQGSRSDDAVGHFGNKISRKIPPHFAPGLSDIFFCDVNVEALPKSPQATTRIP